MKIVSTKKKKSVAKLVEECTETVEEVKLAKITSTEDENKLKCGSCTLYIILILILFTINFGIGSYFAYFYWYLKKDVSRDKELGIKERFSYHAIIY